MAKTLQDHFSDWQSMATSLAPGAASRARAEAARRQEAAVAEQTALDKARAALPSATDLALARMFRDDPAGTAALRSVLASAIQAASEKRRESLLEYPRLAYYEGVGAGLESLLSKLDKLISGS